MKRHIFLFFAFIFYNNIMQGQSLKHAVLGEVGGHSAGYGLSYDVRFLHNNAYQWGAGAVAGTYQDQYSSVGTSTLRGYYLIGKKSSCLELGASFLYHYTDWASTKYGGGDSDSYNAYLQGYLGYRYQPLQGGLTARVYLVPLSLKVYTNEKDKDRNLFLGIIGVSLGYTFKPKNAQ